MPGVVNRAGRHIGDALGSSDELADAIKCGSHVDGRCNIVAPKRLTDADVNDLARQLKDGQIKPKDLTKAGVSPEDIADIEAKSKQLRPRNRGTERIIDQIGKTNDRLKNALERVRRSPKDPEALRELEAVRQELAELQAAQLDLRRRGQ